MASGYLIYTDLHPYRRYRLRHHAKEPESLRPRSAAVTPFPITRASLNRKIWRDLNGRTGWKRPATHRATSGAVARDRPADRPPRMTPRLGVAITNGASVSSPSPVIPRSISSGWSPVHDPQPGEPDPSISEHAMVPDPADDLRNTGRRSPARKRLLIALIASTNTSSTIS
jgi:hypothetical protein